MLNKNTILKIALIIILFLRVSHWGDVFIFAEIPPQQSGEYIYGVWETGGDANGNVYIGDDAISKLKLKKNGEVYLLNHDSKILLFNGKKIAEKYAKMFNIQVWKIVEIGIKNGVISLVAFYDALGNAQDGFLIEEKGDGFAEIRQMPEEIKQAKRNMAIDAAIENSGAIGIWELKDENEKVELTPDVIASLGVQNSDKVFILYYGARAFLFDDKTGAEIFFSSLLSAGAAIDDGNLKEELLTIAPQDVKKPVEYIRPIKPLLRTAKVSALKGSAKKDVEDAIARRETYTVKEFSLSSEIFKSDGFTLTLRGKNIIKRQADEIKDLKYKKITVEGHTSSSGNRSANLVLSRKRAKSVYNEFLANSIPANKIKYIGFSGELPVANNKTLEGKLENRRVDVFVQ
ncbi:MAG: OmpA family protein [Endomicrobium sp.]|nr:OmpA family protein [Endomicrobium sp.]